MDATKPPGRLKVVLLSLPPRTQAVLDFFIANTGRSSFTAAREDIADAAVFDHDHPDSRAHWQQYHERYGRPGIMLSIHAQALVDTVSVAKPITPAALLSAAADVHAGRLQRPAAPMPPAPPAAAPHVAASAPAIVLAFAAAGSLPTSAAAAAMQASAPVSAPLVDIQTMASAVALSPTEQPGTTTASDLRAEEPILVTGTAAPVPGVSEASAAAAPDNLTSAPRSDEVADVAVAVPGTTEASSIDRPVADADANASAPGVARTERVAGVSASVAAPAPPSSVIAASLPASAQAAPTSPNPAAARAPAPQGIGGMVGGFLRKFFVGEAAPAPTPTAQAGAARKTQPSISPAPVTRVPTSAATPAADAGLAARADSASQVDRPAAVPAPSSPRAAEPAAAKPTPAGGVKAGAVSTGQTSRSATPAAPTVPAGAARHPGVTASNPTTTKATASTPHGASPARSVIGGPGGAPAIFANEALYCGNRDELPGTRWGNDTSLRYEPADHLVGALREAWQVGGKWRVPTHFELPQGRVVVDSALGRVFFDFDLARHPEIWTQPLARRPKTRTLNRQESRDFEATKPDSMLRLDQLLWRGGMLTSAGRLPAEVDVTRTLYLKHWPNFTRIERLPQAVRMAALWATRGASIVETAKLVGAPQRHVIAFYNGMAALDLVTEDGSHIRRTQRKGQNRGLLTRLLGWLQH